MLTPLPPDQPAGPITSLFADSLARYPDWCARLQEASGIDPEYRVCGAVQIKANGERRLYPQMAQVRNPRLLKALLAALRQRGVTVLSQTTVHGWAETGGRLRGVITDRGEFPCDAAVLAAGAWSAPLGAAGIAPVKGQMLLAQAEPGQLCQLLIGDEVYLIPRRDGRVLIGSTLEEVGFDMTPTVAAREQLWARAVQLWPALSGLPLIGHWAGLRPRPSGEVPMVAMHPELAGLWLATGHYRLGISLAPGTAAVLGQAIPDWLQGADL